jgi:hypothetical protein
MVALVVPVVSVATPTVGSPVTVVTVVGAERASTDRTRPPVFPRSLVVTAVAEVTEASVVRRQMATVETVATRALAVTAATVAPVSPWATSPTERPEVVVVTVVPEVVGALHRRGSRATAATVVMAD